MYRILKADKDNYITNKLIRAKRSLAKLSSSITSNVGQAGTIDLYKLYKEGGSNIIELSRGLIHFDLEPIRSLTGSFLNINDPSFKCYVSMKNVYGGQPVPSNYDLVLYPLAKNWFEGRGLDVVGYRDLDVSNWGTASFDLVETQNIDYPTAVYEEVVVQVTTASNLVSVPFINSYSSIPPVVITEVSSSNNILVNAFVDNQTSITNLFVGFSTPFVGSFVYRAAFDPAPGTPRTVRRTPRYPNSYTNIVIGTTEVSGANKFFVTYSDFASNPTNTYATLYEIVNDNLANVYVSITASNTTSVGGNLSSTVLDGQMNVFAYRPTSISVSLNTWTTEGAGTGGNSGEIDYYDSFLSSMGYVPLGATQHFNRGDEDLFVDVTTAISATLAGQIPDYGFRISYSGSQETDSVTRFVKRFSTRQSMNSNLHPALVVKYNDTFLDNQAQAWFSYPNKIGLYYSPGETPTNFVSGSTEITGSGSLLLTLLASASQYVTATTYSISHQATINYQSASWVYFSASFTGSQVQIGGLNQTGSYYADVYIPSNAPGLSAVLQGKSTLYFTPRWSSLDGTVEYTRGDDLGMSLLQGSNSVVNQRNYAINITNLKDVYINNDVPRMRVFAYDFDPTITSFYIPYKAQPKIFKNMLWRLIDPYTKEIVVPFDETGTKLSSDGGGMYFDLYMQDLPLNRPLEIELLIKEGGNNFFIENQRFIFKVVTA